MLVGAMAAAAPIIQMSAGRVLLATVVDSRAQTIVDLGIDDFVVTEGAEPREVLDVHVADYPVALVLDDGGDEMAGEAIRASARRFVQRIGERPISISLFSSATTARTSFDQNREQVLNVLGAIPLHGAIRAPIIDVVAHSAAGLRATESPFSAIVVISATPAQAADSTQSDRLPFIVEMHAPVHVVALSAPSAGIDALRGLSEQTRGQYTQVFSPTSFSVALDRLADRLSSEMMVGYLVPPNGGSGDVRVGVKRPGARVLGLGVSK